VVVAATVVTAVLAALAAVVAVVDAALAVPVVISPPAKTAT